jgi:hypothetical protein
MTIDRVHSSEEVLAVGAAALPFDSLQMVDNLVLSLEGFLMIGAGV